MSIIDHEEVRIKAEITDIKWETDGQKVKLPKKVTAYLWVEKEALTEKELMDFYISECLSDNIGWLQNDFNYTYKIVNEDE